MFTYRQACLVLKGIATEAIRSGKLNFPLVLYLYGDVCRGEGGVCVEIIIEVPREVFERYKDECLVYSNSLIRQDCAKKREDFFLKWDRSRQALRVINVEIGAVLASFWMDDDSLDIVCLPVGWNKADSEIFKDLSAEFDGFINPGFLARAASTARAIIF